VADLIRVLLYMSLFSSLISAQMMLLSVILQAWYPYLAVRIAWCSWKNDTFTPPVINQISSLFRISTLSSWEKKCTCTFAWKDLAHIYCW